MRAQGCSYMVTFSGYCCQQLPGQLLVGIIDSSDGIPPTLIMPHLISTSTLAPDGGDDLGAGGQDGCYSVAIRKRPTTNVADMQLCAQANRPASVVPCKCIPDTLRQSRAKGTHDAAGSPPQRSQRQPPFHRFHLPGAGAATKHNTD
ncbi:hypothetical protein NEUTE1DRAFT_102155 [Neurospora tetrasperma FGSC 2508]|uniref:Uncharacterized protein n=1 Tax=Neurospora tetrasperma (strain FGSC 2508 / ATCC MYA-4615 / P0657) TaxID=510951 RepID=F8MRK2_NEUT8|nr:uncharacterized protein NEUTE1DRAFT_102155 [Neurospora tetrasperma FGSC 2508]EGO56903.1 hypothetical protein NEUTE1DRAFT_102155 [Neurospora tetrasperma FGSC 2508]EGZ70194.1 hypothetical protein NEUTE2DRAFT_130217 [Neurospora tetrasperma FGSC 2509]